MSANDELAGRMARMGAARLRGVLPPNELVVPMPPVAPPRPAGIPWVPIADCPEEWKDGRSVLLWLPDRLEPARMGFYGGQIHAACPYWLTVGSSVRVEPTHVAAINSPEGV